LLIAFATASALVAGVVSVVPASAQSISSVKAEIAAAQRQLHALNTSAEVASERYNAARIALASAQQKARTSEQALHVAQARLRAMQQSVTDFAIAAYRGDESMSLLTLAGGSTDRLLGRVSSLQAVSASEAQTLARVSAARRTEEQAQVDANGALAAQRKATSTMLAARTRIIAAANKEQTILAGLQAKETQLIKAAKARAARLAAERAAARLRAQRAAAAAAARAVARQQVAPPAPAPAPAPSGGGSGGGNGGGGGGGGGGGNGGGGSGGGGGGSGGGGGGGGSGGGSGGASVAVAWAYREIGKPYVWGGAGPNDFDCSGLTMYVWAKAGVYLGHYTGDQWNEGTHISRANVQPGDLVFFAYNTSSPATIHHVGIYVGGGEMIDAPYTGVDVRKEYAFRSDYIGAVRPG
jgi:cell wall-associated NlpC family hydrolase